MDDMGGDDINAYWDSLPERPVEDWPGDDAPRLRVVDDSYEQAPAKPEPLPIEWFGDIEPQLHGLWLMKGLLPAQGLGVVHGHPGSGKTFLALTWALHVALGWEWQGRKVRQGLVIYLSAEGQKGLRNRIAAFKKHHGIAHAPVAVIPVAIDMQATDADVNRLIATIHAAEEKCGERAVMVVIDTVSKTFGRGKENTDDMVTYVANCERVAAQFECLTLAIHHRPKDVESEDPRGHSSLKGGAETVILVEAGETKKLRVSKQKDGEDGVEMLFKLKVVDLGLDEDGDPVTSCIVEETDVEPKASTDAPEAKIARLSDNYKRVLQVLDDTAIASGFYPPNEIPDTQIDRNKVGKVVKFEEWRTLYGQQAGQDPDSKPDTVSKTFRRALTRLQNDGIVAVYGEYAWRTWTVRTQPDTGPDTNQVQVRTDRTLGVPPKGGNPEAVRSMSGVRGGDVRPPDWLDEAPPANPDDYGSTSDWRDNPILRGGR